MADIAVEIKTFLKTVAGITALVGSGTAARIYEDRSKQGVALPYIVYEIFPGSTEQHLGGISGMATNRIQIDVYESTSTKAYTIAELVRLAVAGKRQTMGTTLMREHGRGSYDRGQGRVEGANQRRYWISRDYIFTFDEATS